MAAKFPSLKNIFINTKCTCKSKELYTNLEEYAQIASGCNQLTKRQAQYTSLWCRTLYNRNLETILAIEGFRLRIRVGACNRHGIRVILWLHEKRGRKRDTETKLAFGGYDIKAYYINNERQVRETFKELERVRHFLLKNPDEMGPAALAKEVHHATTRYGYL